jgi:probable F420-dependent oxidoreductase
VKIGVTVRNMGPQSAPPLLFRCASAAEAAGLESLWITDHIAILPDDAEGSGGRYLDPLVTLATLAGRTSRILLGTGVLVLPYRPALPTAKQVATLQELSDDRLLLGVGIGWMDAEFRALGLSRHQRGAMSDQILAFLHQCFSAEPANANGQPFLFRPKPARPPIYVGGRAPHALQRAVRFGDGWLPMGVTPETLAPDMARYRALAAEQGAAAAEVTVMTAVPLADAPAAEDMLAAFADLGVERVVCALRYDSADDYLRWLDRLQPLLA